MSAQTRVIPRPNKIETVRKRQSFRPKHRQSDPPGYEVDEDFRMASRPPSRSSEADTDHGARDDEGRGTSFTATAPGSKRQKHTTSTGLHLLGGAKKTHENPKGNPMVAFDVFCPSVLTTKIPALSTDETFLANLDTWCRASCPARLRGTRSPDR